MSDKATVTPPRTERRLAAILAADVVGYSRLMGTDEVGTLNALKMHRRERVDPAIARHHGRIVKTTGDGMLVEFASVVDAVVCAVAIQRAMLTFNAGIHEDRRIIFRIGINVGDIIIDGDDIFGDGVNIAARLETLCEPGGVCISRYANEQVRDKLSLTFADLGEQTVKNIARAVGVFGLTSQDIAALPEEALLQPGTAGGATHQYCARAPPPDCGDRCRRGRGCGDPGCRRLVAHCASARPTLRSRRRRCRRRRVRPLTRRRTGDLSIIVLPFDNSNSGDLAQDPVAAGVTRDPD